MKKTLIFNVKYIEVAANLSVKVSHVRWHLKQIVTRKMKYFRTSLLQCHVMTTVDKSLKPATQHLLSFYLFTFQ